MHVGKNGMSGSGVQAAITRGPESREKEHGLPVKSRKAKAFVWRISQSARKENRERCGLKASVTLAAWAKGAWGSGKHAQRSSERERTPSKPRGNLLNLGRKFLKGPTFLLRCPCSFAGFGH